jgi:Ca-activated chloride channel family protein
MTCPKCNAGDAGGSKFCRRCGAELPPSRGPWRAVAWVAAAAVGLSVVGAVALSLVRVSGSPMATATGNVGGAPPAAAPVVRIGVAYGTEKRDWFNWAADAFAQTPAGRNVKVDLQPMGSLEGAQAVVRGDRSINVWSPASSLYKAVFVRDWTAAHPDGGGPIASEQPVALTPMVFVMWQERFDPFVARYGQVSFRTVARAMAEPGGWDTIAHRPEWGFFKFAHTHPNQSNSGLAALVLMAYDYHGTHRELTPAQITDPAFQQWLIDAERAQVGAASGLIDSTGTLMNAMVQRGWSTYDCVMVYESNAIDRLRQASGRWGPLRVVYPADNVWNDNPYYVLDVPWSTPAQRDAAGDFARFLLSEPAQREAMAHGFRPANVNVPTNGADSPWVQFADVGLRADVPGTFCEPPAAEAIDTLLLGWQRSQGGR